MFGMPCTATLTEREEEKKKGILFFGQRIDASSENDIFMMNLKVMNVMCFFSCKVSKGCRKLVGSWCKFFLSTHSAVLVLRFLVWRRLKKPLTFFWVYRPVSGEWLLFGAADLPIVLHEKLQIMLTKLTRNVKVDNQIEGLKVWHFLTESQM